MRPRLAPMSLLTCLVFACGDKPEDSGQDCTPAEELPYDGLDQDCDGLDLVDVDGDGWDAIEAGGDDCDDQDAEVNPGAEEICNEQDDDCDGLTDGQDVDLVDGITWYQDADGDGHGDPSVSDHRCSQPLGFVTDDADCDDEDATVYPGAPEICGDHLMNDCDGDEQTVADACWVPPSLDAAAAELIGEDEGDGAGVSVAAAGDVDADGHDDFLIGARGSNLGGDNAGTVYLVSGPVSGESSLSAARAVVERAKREM